MEELDVHTYPYEFSRVLIVYPGHAEMHASQSSQRFLEEGSSGVSSAVVTTAPSRTRGPNSYLGKSLCAKPFEFDDTPRILHDVNEAAVVGSDSLLVVPRKGLHV